MNAVSFRRYFLLYCTFYSTVNIPPKLNNHRISTTPCIHKWLQFFLTAVQHSADDAVSRATRMVAIRETYMQEAAATRSSLPALVELIFSNPFITVKRLQMKAQLTPQGARNVLKDATNRGWLSEVGTRGRGGRMWWVAHEVLEIIDSPRSFHHNGR